VGRFSSVALTADEEDLRREVRDFLAAELSPDSERGPDQFSGHDPEFSKRLAARGWVGMAIPPEYGGHGRTSVERFVVVEELLGAGVPIGAHWIADRQIAPALVAFGTPAQRKRFLPAIARGECYFSLGMSESDAGSDLASVRTSARQVEDGWSVTGTKIWTSYAHVNHYAVVLCRTSPLGEDRHQGLSQLIVDLSSPGLTVNPIVFLDGTHSFNEVVLQDVFVPDDMVLGEIGRGWQQITSELAHERSGPDRYSSTWKLLEHYVAEHADAPDIGERRAEAIGGLVARLWTLRQMSLSVARALQQGSAPSVEVAMVKDMGTIFEQDVVNVLQALVEDDPDPESSSVFEAMLAKYVTIAPSYTIRGGSTEVLRTVIARGLRTVP
jgi:alkylation response protein AidB-like acyl-CoA dehydrogenase